MNKSYQDLLVWQKAMLLAGQVYRFSQKLPDSEKFGLIAQLRKAAVSVPSNIAEGQGRLTRGEFKQFLGHARGSLYELETQVRLTVSLGFTEEGAIRELIGSCHEVGRLLNGLLTSLK